MEENFENMVIGGWEENPNVHMLSDWKVVRSAGKKWINANNVKLWRQTHRHQTIEKKKTMYPKYLKVYSYALIEELSNQNTTSNT